MGIDVLPPDVNESFAGFTVIPGESDQEKPQKDRIRFGLTTIKNFGEGITEVIVRERKTNGKFTNLENFLERVNDRNLNKKSLEALIKCGALDAFGERGQLLANLEALLTFSKESGKDNGGQESLFGALQHGKLELRPAPEAPAAEKLAWEKELIGLYISGHPLDKFRAKMEAKGISINKIKAASRQGQSQMIIGVIESVREIRTKNGAAMAFVKLADFSGNMEAVFFPKTYEEYKATLEGDKCLAVEGDISVRNDEKSLLVKRVREI
jgi:DNA polymerase-3 subunit alpha